MVDKVLSLPEESKMMLLAPVVKNRKGEHVKLLDSLAAQGYIRARIDGEICDLSDPPELALQRKHTIEVVVDRFKVRSDLATRLAESFETALELSGGTAVVADMDNPKAEELVFSANFACPHCGYSVPELEPRLFSFNNPAGACPTCDGLGVQQFFDESRVVQNESISLAGGAVKGWDRRNFYYYQMLTSLAKHYNFDVEAPYESLPKKIQHIIMHGSGKEEIEFQYMNDRGDVVIRKHPFEGILNNMARVIKKRNPCLYAKNWQKISATALVQIVVVHVFALKARNVYIGSINLPQISEKSIGESLEFFQGLTLTGQKAQIAEKILKEIKRAVGNS